MPCVLCPRSSLIVCGRVGAKSIMHGGRNRHEAQPSLFKAQKLKAQEVRAQESKAQDVVEGCRLIDRRVPLRMMWYRVTTPMHDASPVKCQKLTCLGWVASTLGAVLETPEACEMTSLYHMLRPRFAKTAPGVMPVFCSHLNCRAVR